jgi:hypothetical protein
MDVHPPKNGIFIGIDPYPYHPDITLCYRCSYQAKILKLSPTASFSTSHLRCSRHCDATFRRAHGAEEDLKALKSGETPLWG